MSRPPMVLMVCLGNICRSPTAEAALRAEATRAGVAVDVRSVGTGAWHLGSPPDARMQRAAEQAGIHLDGCAEQVDVAALREADLVLAMDRSNLRELERIAAAADLDTRIRMYREFDPDAGTDLDLPDPYYGGGDGFADVVAICRRTSRALVHELAAESGR